MNSTVALEGLYRVSQALARSLDPRVTLREVLAILADVGLERGLIGVLESDGAAIAIGALHGEQPHVYADVRYALGEGVLGQVYESGQTLFIAHPQRDARFLDRLGIYDLNRPFVAVPIRSSGETVGVLAGQPHNDAGETLVRFLEMIANLIGQHVRLATEVGEEKQHLAEERDALRRRLRNQYGFDNLVGRSHMMRRVFEQLRLVAKWNTTVLIRGETGTGKELVANAIHFHSPRAQGPLVRLNCAALPEALLETELFGHERGAFTGAVSQRKGRFELAHGGTLFLDEIGEISATFQVKLLRILQEGEFERVGGTRTLKVDVRVIAATHRDLEALVAEGRFREDLYYRLNVMTIRIPPLRERLEDIPDLAQYLVARIAKQQGRALSLRDDAVRKLMQHHWPGNVRELENCLERAAVLSENGVIDATLVQFDEWRTGAGKRNSAATSQAAPLPSLEDAGDERTRIIAALERSGWVQAKAARLLGMTPRQIAYRIQKLNIEIKAL